MAQATKTKDLPAWTAELQSRRDQRDKGMTFKDRTFESLSPAEKDKVLKAVAIRLGMVKDSADS